MIVHGAWGGAWAFKKVEALLRQKGFEVYRPQLTGQGDRVHLARPDIGLTTHIDDVVNTILYEDLRDIILVGHSYGGMVISGVADRVPDRIKRLVYLDAMVPNDGDSVSSIWRGGSDFIKQMTKGECLNTPLVTIQSRFWNRRSDEYRRSRPARPSKSCRAHSPHTEGRWR